MKKDESWRLFVDYWRPNEVINHDAYFIPITENNLNALAGSKYYCTMELTSGYWPVLLDESTFSIRSRLWQWKVLPFGLTSTPAAFQRLTEKKLQGLHWRTIFLYLDDIIVAASDFLTDLQWLGEVFDRLRNVGLKLQPTSVPKKQVLFLRHKVSTYGVATYPAKVETVAAWTPPPQIMKLQAFLGTTGYYSQCIDLYATIAKPLHHLSIKNIKWE